MRAGRLEEAEATLRGRIAVEPTGIPVRVLLAGVLFRQGRLAEAEPLLTAVHSEDPPRADVIGLLALIHKAQGDHAGAAPYFEELVTLGVADPDILNQLGRCYLEVGDSVRAGAAFRKAVELDRSRADSFTNLGLALNQAGPGFEAFLTFKRAANLDPSAHDVYLHIWDQMVQTENWSEGLPILEQGLRHHPQSTAIMTALASTYSMVGRPDEAEALFRSTLALDESTRMRYVHWLYEQGRFQDAEPILLEAIERQPLKGEAYYRLANARQFDVNARRLTDIISPLLQEDELTDQDRMFFHYALAKTYDQDRNEEMAMRHYDLANEAAYGLYNAGITHETRSTDIEHAALERLYTQEGIAKAHEFGSPTRDPIFILGMIRTGTTLLNQILASHPEVKSCGEQPFWMLASGRVNRKWLDSGFDPRDLRDLAGRYLGIVAQTCGDSPRVVDKMPTNYHHAGLISMALPNSKLIHLRRNPLDTCLSIYTTFLGPGTQFAYNKRNIIGYYRAYLDIMEHWRKVLPPGQMLEIDYEDLVTDKETVLRRVLDFGGLSWNENVLSHESHAGQVSTPSLYTARQPVNARSVARWRRFEPWLGEFLELKDVRHPG